MGSGFGPYHERQGSTQCGPSGASPGHGAYKGDFRRRDGVFEALFQDITAASGVSGLSEREAPMHKVSCRKTEVDGTRARNARQRNGRGVPRLPRPLTDLENCRVCDRAWTASPISHQAPAVLLEDILSQLLQEKRI